MASAAPTAPAAARRDPHAGDQLAGLRARPSRKRMLIIVNPYATTVSDRLKNLVVYALQGRYDVEAVMTEAKNHATEIGREAVEGGYDIVVAFGGDGTLNELANGLAGTDVPVSVLPGGSTNVVARTLGIPNDVVDATEHLLGIADDFRPRKIDLGVASGRRFVFSCGAGIDATAAKRVDAHPKLKSSIGPYYYTWAAISGFYRQYLRSPVRMRVVAGDQETEGVTSIVQNTDPFTFFRDHPVTLSRDVSLDDGQLVIVSLRRATQRDMPFIIGRVLVERLGGAQSHRHVDEFRGVTQARIESISRDNEGVVRPFPVQVDGDYIGEHGELDISIESGALTVVA
jgi:diacylglycerol kinase family enzyme